VPPTTWVDRIMDTTNNWLRAIRLEGGGRLSEAVILYVEDARACLGKGEPARAALDCSCAADCLSKMGEMEYARGLYREAARAYLENAGMKDLSIRESLWSMKVAHSHFLLAKDDEAARELYSILAPLTRRIDSFAKFDDALGPQGTGLSSASGLATAYPSPSLQAISAVKRFLQDRHLRPEEIAAKERVAIAVLAAKVGSSVGEKNSPG